MTKKLMTGLRVIIYGAAVYLILDIFLFSDTITEMGKLNLYDKKDGRNYYEFFINMDKDSVWNGLQTSPAFGKTMEIGPESPWTNPEQFETFFNEKGLLLIPHSSHW